MALKGKKPEEIQKRLKMFVYGQAGCGKTVQALMFPSAYIIDCERGTDEYASIINKAGSVVFQSVNPDEIYEQVRELLTTKHPYKTLIIDPVTHVYNAVQDKWNRIYEKYADTQKDKDRADWGMGYWGKVKRDFKRIQRLLLQLDMNVIVTSHQKDVYGENMKKVGVTFDSMRGDDYLFDIVFRIEKGKDKTRIAICEKERSFPSPKFPDSFEWTYDNFLKHYGQEVIEKESAPMQMATPDQIVKIRKLVETVKIDPTVIDKWFTKADVSDWDEMNEETIIKCIEHVEKKLKELNGVTVGGVGSEQTLATK